MLDNPAPERALGGGRERRPSRSSSAHVDTVEEMAIMAIRPKPAFRPVIEEPTTKKGSGVVLINGPPLANEPEAADLCSMVENVGDSHSHSPSDALRFPSKCWSG